jgi:collagenase-like PrtC family protease
MPEPTTAEHYRQERDDALAELQQWRANHDDQVRRKQAVQGMYEQERAENKRLREALRAIASCASVVPGDAIDIARRALENAPELVEGPVPGLMRPGIDWSFDPRSVD